MTESMEVQIDGIKSVYDLDGHPSISVFIGWACEKGFGGIEIEQTIIDGDAKFYIDNEMMSRDFIKRVLCALVDSAWLKSDGFVAKKGENMGESNWNPRTNTWEHE